MVNVERLTTNLHLAATLARPFIAFANGGFGAATDPLDYPPWPWHERDLRHVTGYDTTNNDKHSRLVIATNNFALFTSGGTWNNSNTGRSYTVQGAEGERRPANHLK